MEQLASELVLNCGNARVGVVPSCGAALSFWRIGGRDILRPAAGPLTDPLQAASFVLAPFSNVMDEGGLHFAGDFFPLLPNHPQEPLPIHGDAWLAVWQVLQLSAHSVEAHYRHDPCHGYPFAYQVKQTIALSAARLKITLQLCNLDKRTMPAGLGLHPYFRRPADTRLLTRHRGRWEQQSTHTDPRFLRWQTIPSGIDDCFSGWDRRAQLYWPDESLQITLSASRAAAALVVYSPPNADYVCLEPVSHVNAGLNSHARGLAQTGVQLIRPGQTMELSVSIRVAHVARAR